LGAGSGFTLIELMMAVAIIGVLAATAIPAFSKYIRKAKTAEARQNLKKISDGARQYYLDQQAADVTGMQPLPPQFPSALIAITPWDNTCCANGAAGTKEKCQPTPNGVGDHPAWTALQFSLSEPTYYLYFYYRSGPPFGNEFTAWAQGNLDCDNQISQFTVHGFVDPTYADGPISTNHIVRLRELE
jgi:prepilin-type N-terminal cleavage/methylation domain-containing protein